MAWLILFLVVGAALALDLGVFNKDDHEVGVKEASYWTVTWIVLSLLFALGIAIFDSQDQALLFLTGYVVEKSLSIDNIFLFIVIFQYFNVAPKYQHRILFWGILGAIITRGVLIVAGVELLHKFHWLMYVFGALILYTGVKTLFFNKDEEIDIENNFALKLVNKFIPTNTEHEGNEFIITENGKRYATKLMVVLLVVELTDIMFAFDSIPAILGITTDPFIVYSSNLLAILGLRALYFVLAGMIEYFKYLSLGVSLILIFVGLKMLLASWIHISPFVSLGIICMILIGTVLPTALNLAKEKKT